MGAADHPQVGIWDAFDEKGLRHGLILRHLRQRKGDVDDAGPLDAVHLTGIGQPLDGLLGMIAPADHLVIDLIVGLDFLCRPAA